YAVAEWRDKFRLASENPIKDDLVELLLDQHDAPGDRVLIIGQYLKQLRRIAARFDLPLITGQTTNAEREDLYGRFRRGELRKLVLSKVGNFAIDLPDANVMIQVSGTFGSRQEEAQRLGRILRPKPGEAPATFYTLVSRDTREMDFAHHRQLFLTEQGYSYEILDKTDIADDLVATYTGDSKDIAPVTVATYQIVTYRPKKDGDFPHFQLFNQRDWGLIIYDEVHLLPAPVFRITSEIQARRRLGLTATLLREDGREEDVFSLIGPKKFDVPWRVLESKGWIAEAQCHEVRLGLPGDARMEYAVAEWRDKFRLASENPIKDDLVELLLDQHDAPGDRVLIIG
ncbi:MAG: hypothetical protein LC745_06410, partial [Planctomycetia bacterium]|nr:hypothetical protein [Planctomycetia bacterium]